MQLSRQGWHWSNTMQFTRTFCMFLDRLSLVATHVGEHGPLLRAIAGGDGEKAANLAHDHVIGFETAVRAVI
jgi:DNA-binding GntR family transcriptional regulator